LDKYVYSPENSLTTLALDCFFCISKISHFRSIPESAADGSYLPPGNSPVADAATNLAAFT
jgi:hypothetical protein